MWKHLRLQNFLKSYKTINNNDNKNKENLQCQN